MTWENKMELLKKYVIKTNYLNIPTSIKLSMKPQSEEKKINNTK
jgi:hypothetical protein